MKKILIIDDDPSHRFMLKTVLEQQKYEIFEAENGNVGLEKVRKNPCHLVITDIFMPEKEGFETMLEIRSIFDSVKIMAISGGGVQSQFMLGDVLDMAKDFGADAIMKKPLDMPKFLDLIKELVGD